MSGPFATATEFCEFTGMSMPTDLARLQSMLDMASATIRIHCDRELSQVTGDAVTFGPVSRDTLILPETPVTAIASVVENAVTLVAGTDYTFTDGGLVYRWTNILLNTGRLWSKGATVTYSHGYAETAYQFTKLKTICIEAAARAFTLNERSASEALGSTLMESAGYAPEIFLTDGEKAELGMLDAVTVG